MTKQLKQTRGYLFLFLAALWTLSTLDYIDHITRTNTTEFRDHWLAWFAFTFSSTITISLVALTLHLVGPRRGLSRAAIDSVAVMLMLPIHVMITGPIFDTIFWDGNLVFDHISPVILLPVLLIYWITRAVYAGAAMLIGLTKRPSSEQLAAS